MSAINIKERLSKAREACPYMPEGTYIFTDYLTQGLNDPLEPEGLVLSIALALATIEGGEYSFGAKIPDQIAKNKDSVIVGARYILQIIDEVADEDFAATVRVECKETFGWVVAKRPKLTDRAALQETCRPCTIAAVEWWTTAIQLNIIPGWFKNMPPAYKEFTAEEIMAFRKYLAEHIEAELTHALYSCVALKVDYQPEGALAEAAAIANMRECDIMFQFPSKTRMYVQNDRIEVHSADKGENVIWHA